MCKGEVKGGGVNNGNESASLILLLESINRQFIPNTNYSITTASGYMTFVGLSYPEGDKLEKVYTGYKV